jgi:hypothetical protein
MLNISSNNFFDKSPMHSPSKVLGSLDLLSVSGKFLSKSGDVSPGNGEFLTPTRYRRVHEGGRRKSLISDLHFEHTISDEFAHIQLNVTERRSSSGSIYNSHALNKNHQNFNQKVVLAKVRHFLEIKSNIIKSSKMNNYFFKR